LRTPIVVQRGITDAAAFAGKLTNGADAMSVFLRGRLQDSVKADLAAYSAAGLNAKAVIAALVRDLNQAISGPSIYDKERFSNVVLRPEAEQLLKQNPRGRQLARLNKLLLEDAYPGGVGKEHFNRLDCEGRRHRQHWRRARGDLHGEGVQSLPAHVYAEACLGQSGPSGMRSHFLQPAASRGTASR
jgi:hypothetical protein